MPNKERRYGLVIYAYMLNRWWTTILAIGISLLILSGGLGILPIFFPQYPLLWVSDWKLWGLASVGSLAILLAIFMMIVRKYAYVQLFNNYLRLTTPFLRMNISYQRIRRTYFTEMKQLFPANKIKGRSREILRPLYSESAVVLELNEYPLSKTTLRLFLSPFFFPGKYSSLAILVADSIAFSTALDSLRDAWKESLRK